MENRGRNKGPRTKLVSRKQMEIMHRQEQKQRRTKKWFTEEEKKVIIDVFGNIKGKEKRTAALVDKGLGYRNYNAMGNFYSRYCKKKGLNSGPTRVRYSDEDRDIILRIFSETKDTEERKALVSEVPRFANRSYASLYQQYNMMMRSGYVGTKRRRDDDDDSDDDGGSISGSDNDDSDDDSGSTSTNSSDNSKRRRVDGYDSDGNDPLDVLVDGSIDVEEVPLDSLTFPDQPFFGNDMVLRFERDHHLPLFDDDMVEAFASMSDDLPLPDDLVEAFESMSDDPPLPDDEVAEFEGTGDDEASQHSLYVPDQLYFDDNMVLRFGDTEEDFLPTFNVDNIFPN